MAILIALICVLLIGFSKVLFAEYVLLTAILMLGASFALGTMLTNVFFEMKSAAVWHTSRIIATVGIFIALMIAIYAWYA